MPKKKNTLSVVVTGDVTIDWNIAHHTHELREPTDWTGESSSSMNWQFGSAALLADLITATTTQLKVDYSLPIEVTIPVEPSKVPASPYDHNFFHSSAVWALYHDKDPKTNKPGDPHWRVKQFLGLDQPIQNKSDSDKKTNTPNDPTQADIIVIDDSNLGFRDQPARWPQIITQPSQDKKAPWILVKMSNPISEGALWERLVAKYPDRLIAVLTIDDLRQSEIQVSARISWESTAEELNWELAHNLKINGLNNAAYCIVSFGPTGALILPGRLKPMEKTKLLFDPHCMEGEWSAGKGMMIGKTSTLVASIVRQILLNPDSPDLIKGIQSGITAMRYLQKSGYDAGKDPITRLRFPTDGVIAMFKNEESPLAIAELPTDDGYHTSPASVWTILRESYQNNLEALSQRIVLEGTKNALHNVPIGTFGKLVTVDRQEIESLRSIYNLMTEYCNRPAKSPISIAVFGPPGSGKSFAVKQIAKVANPDKIAEKTLTFNLSQFNNPHELIDAFHQIRDVGLSGKIPLVFWDEFDTKLEGNKLGWLRFFLAPMQDGEFQQGQLTHPIGRAIFVFAGGTAHSIEKFEAQEELEEAKGPDFLSRLKGFLNVLGPNPQEDDKQGDPYFMVRRALLLRSLFERETQQLLDENHLQIDKGILRAFLQIDNYRHGARSIESLVAMSRLGNATQFNRSYLPPEKQLRLHVNPKAFMALVHQLELEGDLLETLAKQNHEFFYQTLKKQGYVKGKVTNEKAHPKTHSSMVAYDELTEHEREQNRGAVRDIPNKLAALGYAMVPRRHDEPDVVFPKQELESMAKLEHDRWVAAKENDGWKYAPKTDKDKKRHKLLVDWEKLPDIEKDKDRLIIATMSDIVGKTGYTIVKLEH